MTNANYPNPSRDHEKLLQLIGKHPGLNLLPLVELVAEDEEPEYLEAFCNEVIGLVAGLYREEQTTVLPNQVMRVILQLHTLRETFRRLRNAPSWP
jgi:hypothetical protein